MDKLSNTIVIEMEVYNEKRGGNPRGNRPGLLRLCRGALAPPYIRVLLLSRNRFAAEQYFSSRFLAGPGKVEGAIDTPERHYSKGDVRFLPAHAADHERSDQVEEHDD